MMNLHFYLDEPTTSTIPPSHQHHDSNDDLINVGYIRKSPSDETPVTRVRLLNKMAEKVKCNQKCTIVFASPCCRSTSQLVRRDAVTSELLGLLEDVQEDMQGNLINSFPYTVE